METLSTTEQLLARIEALTERMAVLESSLAELARRLDAQAPATPSTNGAGYSNGAAHLDETAPAVPALKISAGLASVIKLIAVGQGDEAHRAMRELPPEELREQPAVVALVAAALCVQRGDYSSGLTALTKARTLTDDPRLLRVMQAIEKQMQ